MSVKIFICCTLFITLVSFIRGHIPNHITIPSDRVDYACYLAESCVHDTIPVCGQRGEEKRTFMDDCDLLEFGCDTGNVYSHIDETPGCPVRRPRL